MKRKPRAIIALLCASILSGCATTIPYTYEEQCADTNMKLRGVTYSSGSTSAMIGKTSGFARSNNQSVSCEAPNSDEERGRIAFLRESYIEPKEAYNKTVNVKKWITGIGYLWLLPGIAAKFYYDYEREAVTDKINTDAKASLKQSQQSTSDSLR